MDVRVITLRFDATLGGFPEAPLRELAGAAEIAEVREHFFVHLGTPYLAFVVLTGGPVARAALPARSQDDPSERLDPALVPLYRSLRQWRNERARRDGVPSYLLMRNAQLAEICRRVPRSLAELRAIEGIGEATCRTYGAELLALIPADLRSSLRPSAPADTEAPVSPDTTSTPVTPKAEGEP